MHCPNCQQTLVTLEFAGIEIDYCVACRGIWLDSGELELLLESQGAEKYYPDSVRKDACHEKGRRCPVCRHTMTKICIGGPAIVLDRCEKHGLWFDRRELRAVLADSSPGPLVKQLDEMLASDEF